MRKWVRVVLLAGVAGFAVAASWAIVDTGIHMTSDDAFCTNCHSHEPIGTSYRADLHGGKNSSGWRATCSQCHIPHDNAIHYLWVKGVHGIRDPLMEMIKDPLEIDWHGHRQYRERFVYDSGCMDCHKNLEQQTLANGKAFLPHRDYFSGSTEKKCVSCHEHVGHAALGKHLVEHGWLLPDGEPEP